MATIALTHLRVRDDAWARMDPEHKDAHIRLWTDVVRRAQARLRGRTCLTARLGERSLASGYGATRYFAVCPRVDAVAPAKMRDASGWLPSLGTVCAVR
jgi:hypothetical protein